MEPEFDPELSKQILYFYFEGPHKNHLRFKSDLEVEIRAHNVIGEGSNQLVEVKITPFTVAKLTNLPEALTYEEKVELRKMNYYLKNRIKDKNFNDFEHYMIPGV